MQAEITVQRCQFIVDEIVTRREAFAKRANTTDPRDIGRVEGMDEALNILLHFLMNDVPVTDTRNHPQIKF